MADIRVSRRERSQARGFCVAWLALALASCADLLDLPSDPHLEGPAAEPVESEPIRGNTARGEPGNGPAPLLSEGAGGGDSSSTDSMNAGPAPDTDDGDPAPTATSGGGDAPIAADAGAGSPPVAPPDAGAAEPPAEPEAPPEPEEPQQPEVPNPCPAPEIVGPNGRCFLVIDEALAWEDARDNCQDRGDDWDLAAIRSAAVNDFVGTLTDLELWIGGSDAASEATWRWVNEGDAFWSGDGTTGEAVDGAFEAWNSNEPNGRGASDCARTVPIIRTGEGMTWADLECFELRASLCEGPPLEL